MGSICGGLIVATFGKIEGQARYALMVQVLLGCIIFLFSRSTVMGLSLVLIFFSGAAMMISMSMVSSLVQAVASDEMRGRVMSVYNVAFRGGMPVGSIVLGKLIPIFSAPVIMSWTGALLSVLGLYYLLVQRRVAQL
jgi:predicted MFS family arabinose efflux permease